MYPHFLGVLIVVALFLVSLFAIFSDLREWWITGHLFYQGIAFLFITIVAYSLMAASFDPEKERIETFLNNLYKTKSAPNTGST
jgi:hypothetical protein